ncbi:hypothetical protein ACVR2G_004349, partial [Cronobacter sakazakii]
MNTAKLKAAAERANAAMNDYVGGVIDAAEFQRLAAEFHSLTDIPDQILMLISALEAAHKRNAELEQALSAAQNDEIDARCHVAELESRKVALPRPACTYADHSYPAYSEKQVVELLESLG